MRPKQPKYIAVDWDRHGNERVYFRKPGQRKIRLRGPVDSAEFWDDYKAASSGESKPAQFVRSRAAAPPEGSFSALCVKYYQSPEFRDLSDSTANRRRRILDSIREKRGDAPAKLLTRRHVYEIIDAAPARETRNAILKALRQLYGFGVERELVALNPTLDIRYQRPKDPGEGYHIWTPDEIDAYERRHPVGTVPRLSFDLMVYTGQRRSDAIQLGRQHVKDGRLCFTQQKTKKRLEIPIHPKLAESIASTPTGDMTFLATKYKKPFKSSNSFGNMMRHWCDQAGLPKCSAHGLRKVAAHRLAEIGCTVHEIMAITGHDSIKEVERYTAGRDQRRIADRVMKKYADYDFSLSPIPPEKELRYGGTAGADKPAQAIESIKQKSTTKGESECMVPPVRLERTRLAARDFESRVSTNSTTGAFFET